MLEGERGRGLIHIFTVLHRARQDLVPKVLAEDDAPLAGVAEVDVPAMIQAEKEWIGVQLTRR